MTINDESIIWNKQYEHVEWSQNIEIEWIQNKIKDKCLVLDAGCGDGRYIFQINRKCIFIGVDISKNAITKLKKNNINNKKIECFISSVTQIPFQNNSFDYILCIGVLQHLSTNNRIKTILELVMKVKPMGLIFIEVFGIRDMRYKINIEKMNHFTYIQKNNILYHYFSLREIINLFKEQKNIKLVYFQSIEIKKKINGKIYVRNFYRYIYYKE